MRLSAALHGNLSKYMEDEYKNGAKAVTLGIKSATNGLKTSMRNQVKSVGLSNRLANTWRGDVYPKGKKSVFAAGLVYSKAPKIMSGFEYQSIIRGKNGFWLAIPTDAIPKRALGKKMTPELYERSRNTRLHFIYRRNGASLLVHERKRKSIIAFWLVSQVRMPKLINFATEGVKWQRNVPRLILQNWQNLNQIY